MLCSFYCSAIMRHLQCKELGREPFTSELEEAVQIELKALTQKKLIKEEKVENEGHCFGSHDGEV